jgi:MoxR-like ATPase
MNVHDRFANDDLEWFDYPMEQHRQLQQKQRVGIDQRGAEQRGAEQRVGLEQQVIEQKQKQKQRLPDKVAGDYVDQNYNTTLELKLELQRTQNELNISRLVAALNDVSTRLERYEALERSKGESVENGEKVEKVEKMTKAGLTNGITLDEVNIIEYKKVDNTSMLVRLFCIVSVLIVLILVTMSR